MISSGIKFTTLLLSIIFGMICFAEHNVMAKQPSKERSKEIIIVADDSSINILDLSNNEETNVDKEGSFKATRIDKEGKLITYLKDSGLYLADISNNNIDIVNVEGNVVAYEWQDDNTLIYLTQKGSLRNFDILSKSTKDYIESEIAYEYIQPITEENYIVQ